MFEFENLIVNIVVWVSLALGAALFLTFLVVQFVDGFKKIIRRR